MSSFIGIIFISINFILIMSKTIPQIILIRSLIMIKCELTLPRLLDSLLVHLPFGPSHKPRVPVCNKKKHNCKNTSIVKTKDEFDSQYSKKEREGEMTSMTFNRLSHTEYLRA